MSSIVGNIIGGAGSLPKTYILQTKDGQEIPAVLTEEEVDITATANDIRLGKVAVTENGVIEGTKVIPSYHTTESARAILNGSRVTITTLKDLELYNYTKLQAIICEFNSSLSKSVSAIKVAINDVVYEVQSTVPISNITVDTESQIIDFGITNDTGSPLILRFFTYKEIE